MYKFGKLAPKYNPRSLLFRTYVDSLLPAPPGKNYWEYKVPSWPMMGNDTLGDCVFACGGHMVQNWTAHTGTMVTPTDDEIIAAYSAVGGYVPGDPSTDNGANITDFLQYWMDSGFAGRKIAGWAQIALNSVAIRQALYLFGSVDIGIQVPAVAMDQFKAGMPWDVVSDDGGIEGGHSIPIMGQGSQGFAVITWGKIQYMTNAFFDKYCDEAYAIVTQDWLDAAGKSPIAGLDLATLQADLLSLRAQGAAEPPTP